MPLDSQRRMPDAPDNAADDDGSCCTEQRFHFLVHISAPAEFLADCVPCKERSECKHYKAVSDIIRDADAVGHFAEIPVPVNKRHGDIREQTLHKRNHHRQCIIFQMPPEIEMKERMRPALFCDFARNDIRKHRRIDHRQTENYIRTVEPVFISDCLVQDDRRNPRNAECKEQEQHKPFCFRFFILHTAPLLSYRPCRRFCRIHNTR